MNSLRSRLQFSFANIWSFRKMKMEFRLRSFRRKRGVFEKYFPEKLKYFLMFNT